MKFGVTALFNLKILSRTGYHEVYVTYNGELFN